MVSGDELYSPARSSDHRLQLQTNANSTLPVLDTQRPVTTRITFWARRQHCDPAAIQLPQRSTVSLDFENWVAHEALVRLRGTRGGLGIVLSSLHSTFHFLRRACWCCCFSLFLCGILTSEHTYSSCFEQLSTKIASTELHLPSPLCLHLPKKAFRLELSFNWFQECTYLYLSHVYCNCSIRHVQASTDRRQIFSRADLIVLSVQNPLTVA
jgi:hypothetical protein